MVKLTKLLLVIALSFCYSHAHDHLIQKNGQPHDLLIELCRELKIKTDGEIKQIDGVLQKNYFCKPGQERWHLKEVHHDKRDALMKIFTKLGLVKNIQPAFKKYGYIIVHGATISTMRNRLNYLQHLWRAGLIRADKIVFVTGERPLEQAHNFDNAVALLEFDKASNPYNESWQRPIVLPHTEGEAAKLLWDQIIIDPTLRSVPLEFITVDRIVDPQSGKVRRARTRDTIEKWLENRSQPGQYLAISSNPHIHSQDQTVYNILKERGLIEQGASIETVGPASNSNTSIAEYLDTIARWLHSEIVGYNLDHTIKH